MIVSGPPLPAVVKAPAPGRGVVGSEASAHSQAALHGQGLGLGLALITAGASGGQQGGGAWPSAPAFSASATTARPGSDVGSLAVNLPTYVAGNIVLVNLCGNFLTSTDTASAAGWTQDGVVASGQRILFAFHRVMNGSEGSSVTFTFSTAFERPFAVAATYSGTTGVEASKPTHLDTPSTTWSCGPITTTAPNGKVVAFGFAEGADYGAIDGGGVARIDRLDAGQAALIADLPAPVAANYSMSGAVQASTTIHTILVGLKT